MQSNVALPYSTGHAFSRTHGPLSYPMSETTHHIITHVSFHGPRLLLAVWNQDQVVAMIRHPSWGLYHDEIPDVGCLRWWCICCISWRWFLLTLLVSELKLSPNLMRLKLRCAWRDQICDITLLIATPRQTNHGFAKPNPDLRACPVGFLVAFNVNNRDRPGHLQAKS